MRTEKIQQWAQEVVFGEPPPSQPPCDENGEPIYDEPSHFPKETVRHFRDRDIYEEFTKQRDTGSTTCEDPIGQIKLLSKAGPDRALCQPPKLLPAVARTDGPSPSTDETYTSDRQSHLTYAQRIHDLDCPGAPWSLPKGESKTVKFEGIDCTGVKVAKMQQSKNNPQPPPKAAKKYYQSRFKEHLDPDELILPYPYLTGRVRAGSEVSRSNAVRKPSNPLY